MSLIKCSECGKEISDHASACIFCGNPIEKEKIVAAPKTKTGRHWKLIKWFSWFWFFAGVILVLFNFQEDGFYNGFVQLGGLIVCLGIVGVIIGKIGAWRANK
jgi:predicted nucleic acid-binding Zn ribbon protein